MATVAMNKIVVVVVFYYYRHVSIVLITGQLLCFCLQTFWNIVKKNIFVCLISKTAKYGNSVRNSNFQRTFRF